MGAAAVLVCRARGYTAVVRNSGPGIQAARTVLHVDMDAFFASVEQRDNPELRGKPVLVGGSSARGVVTAASYEARVYGCRSAMPTGVALRLCPHAIVVRGRFEAYRTASRQVFAIVSDYTPLVQPLSIDEAFLDVTGSLRLFGDGPAIAREIRRRVKETTGLTCSVGVAPNKFLAKLASDMNKPDGLKVIAPDEIESVLAPLPLSSVWGIGPKTVRKLEGFGVRTVAHLRAMPEEFLYRYFGEDGAGIRNLLYGMDDRPVTPDGRARTIGHEQTFGHDIGDLEELRGLLLGQVEHVAMRLRSAGRLARGVSIKLRHGGRFSEFVTRTRRTTLPSATDQTELLWHAARALLEAWWAEGEVRPLRLLGTSLTEFVKASSAPASLFSDTDAEKRRRLDATIDGIARRLGREALGRASARHRSGSDGPKKNPPTNRWA